MQPLAIDVIAQAIRTASDDRGAGGMAEDIIDDLARAGFVIVGKEPPDYMNSQAKANYRMNVQVGTKV